jgi:hypothetical protein
MTMWLFNKHAIQTMKEIEVYVLSKEKEANILGLTFNASEFIKRVENTRLTTHMDLRQAFEYERDMV